MSANQQEIDRLIEQFDPESSFRRLAGLSAKIILVLCAGLSAWHYYTAEPAGQDQRTPARHHALQLSGCAHGAGRPVSAF